jgi:hypothetical protein
VRVVPTFKSQTGAGLSSTGRQNTRLIAIRLPRRAVEPDVRRVLRMTLQAGADRAPETARAPESTAMVVPMPECEAPQIVYSGCCTTVLSPPASEQCPAFQRVRADRPTSAPIGAQMQVRQGFRCFNRRPIAVCA